MNEGVFIAEQGNINLGQRAFMPRLCLHEGGPTIMWFWTGWHND